MLACPSTECGSTNVQLLALYWESLSADSPLKHDFAPPAAVDSRAWLALLGVIVGIVMLVNGTILLGLLVAVAGLLAGAWDRQAVAAYRHSRSEWDTARICLGCRGRF